MVLKTQHLKTKYVFSLFMAKKKKAKQEAKCSIRSPICTVLGHVDHGKSSILDQVRGSAIVKGEAGGITQAIGASIIPLDVVRKVCGKLLDSLKMDFTIPGLLFIDTPGHEAFSNLRKRGGNLADIAILVVDINEGFMPQTIEAIEILKQSKTPFIVAANKIDLISGWKESNDPVLANVSKQGDNVIKAFETKMYELVGKLSEFELNSERFDRVDDFTKQVAIIPTSAKTGEGIPELLMVVTGLAQKFLEKGLVCDTEGDAKGTVLEVKEEKGLGLTMDVIIYDGTLKTGDQIIIGSIDEPIVSKIKALFEPMPLAEMRDKKSKFKPVKSVCAATGVKISAPGTEEVIAGMPIRGSDDVDKAKKEIMSEVKEVLIETDKDGIIVKADSLGSLEALTSLLKGKNVAIRKASVGDITKKDISEAKANLDDDPLSAVIVGFSVAKPESKEVKIIVNDVIYKLIDDLGEWQSKKRKGIETKELAKLILPCKFEVMKGYVFRQSNPAIFGVHIIEGLMKSGMPVMNEEGEKLSDVKGIQLEQKNIEKAEKGKEVALSLDKVTVGRQVNEGDILYSAIPEEDFRKLKQLKSYLSKEDIELLKEIADIMRKKNPVWGV